MTYKALNIVIVFWIILFSSSLGKTQNHNLEEKGIPLINYFSPKTYKSDPRNWSITQDQRGVMYFGNASGVLEYDGNWWRKIIVPGNQSVRSITSDKNGRVYVCASTEFGYLEPDSIGRLKFKSLLPFLNEKYKNFGEIWDVAVSTEGVFFKTRSEIFKWNGSEITVFDSVFAFRLYNINDTIYSRNNGVGLMQIDGDSLKLMPNGDFFASIGVYNMLPFQKDGNVKATSILITTQTDGLFVLEHNKIRQFKTEADEYLIANQIYNTSSITSNNNFAFVTQRGGLVIIDKRGKLVEIINENSGLQSNVCFDVYADKNNGLWIASDFGINYLKEPSSISVFKNKGSLKNITYSVVRYKGRIYATNELGTLVWDKPENGFQLLKGSDQPAYVFGKFEDELFVGTNDGTYRVEGNSIGKKIFDGSTKYIYPSKIYSNRIYIASYYGFSVLEKINGKFVETFSKQLSDESIKLIEDDDGSLWINGFFEGMVHVTGDIGGFSKGLDDNVKYEVYDNTNGLHGDISFINKIKNEIVITTNEAVFTFDHKSRMFKPFKALSKILTDSTNQILLIDKGQDNNLWILAEIENKLSLGKAELQKDGTYNWNPIPELWRINLETVLDIYSDIDPKTKMEKLWISTQEGLILYDGKLKERDINEFKPLIRKVLVSGDSLIYDGAELNSDHKKIELEFANNDVSFEYTAIQYDKPNSTYFQTFLEGDEDGWSNWSLENKKNFTNLSQGNYKFHVKAKDIYGIVSYAEPFTFTILAPWYLTWWAFLIYISFIGGSLYSIRKLELDRKERNNRLRMSELKAEAAEFQAKAAETQAKLMQADNDRKTKELEEARALQISMLPKSIPQFDDLEIAVFMKTATEVGGDYYDFSTKDDGSLNVCLGDATGHGMKAGTLVSMMKSIFTVDSNKLEIDEFFYSANMALKKMSLGKMMMAFGMINIKNYTVKFCNAGIPSFYLIRNRQIEELEIHGLPLGAMKNLKYTSTERILAKNDVVFMMSDGFPELQNETGELFGYDQFKTELEKVKELSASEIINHFKELFFSWAKIKEPEDDVTFVVIRVK